MTDETATVDPAFVRANELVKDLMSDPTLGSTVRAKAREKFPDVPFDFVEDRIAPQLAPLKAELDTANAKLGEALDRLSARDTADQQREDDRQMQSRLEAARSKFNLTDHGLQLAVDRMKETGNYADAEAAAAWVIQSAPKPAAPGPTWAPSAADFYGSKNASDEWAMLHKDPQAYQDAQLNAFVADPDGYTRETLGI